MRTTRTRVLYEYPFHELDLLLERTRSSSRVPRPRTGRCLKLRAHSFPSADGPTDFDRSVDRHLFFLAFLLRRDPPVPVSRQARRRLGSLLLSHYEYSYCRFPVPLSDPAPSHTHLPTYSHTHTHTDEIIIQLWSFWPRRLHSSWAVSGVTLVAGVDLVYYGVPPHSTGSRTCAGVHCTVYTELSHLHLSNFCLAPRLPSCAFVPPSLPPWLSPILGSIRLSDPLAPAPYRNTCSLLFSFPPFQIHFDENPQFALHSSRPSYHSPLTTIRRAIQHLDEYRIIRYTPIPLVARHRFATPHDQRIPRLQLSLSRRRAVWPREGESRWGSGGSRSEDRLREGSHTTPNTSISPATHGRRVLRL